jgi:hypothetical protein
MLAIQAGIVNYQRLGPIFGSYFPDLDAIDIDKQFPEIIPLKYLLKPGIMNVYGILQTSDDVFDVLLHALTIKYKTGSDAALRACIDVEDETEAEIHVQTVKKLLSEITGHKHAVDSDEA